MNNDAQIKAAIDLLNKNNYIVIPITKGQVFLCEQCNQNEGECRYSALGYTCSNLLCLNSTIKEQLDVNEIINANEL